MSESGRLCIEHIDRLYKAELERVERVWWTRYATTLTQAERTLIAEGRDSFTRPRRHYLPEPQLPLGAWIVARAHLEVKLTCTPAAKAYVYEVTESRDFRSPRMHMRRTHEDPDNMTTLNLIRPNVDPPEPGRITKAEETKMAKASGEAEILRLREHWEAKRAEIEQAIADLREAGIKDRELFIIERRLERLDGKLAEVA